MTSPSVYTIVLNWNGRDDTLECLESLSKVEYPDLHVVVVDNGSVDGSVPAIRKQYPDVMVLETGANLGFAGGNNVGLGWCLKQGAEYLLLLNNDTVVDPEIINNFVDAAGKCREGGVFGAKIFYYDQPELIWYAGAEWDPVSARDKMLGYNEKDSGQFSSLAETSYVTGCALFTSAEVVNKIGMLDDAMFLMFEDADFCYRAKQAGYRMFFVPQARVWHRVSRSLGPWSPLMRYFYARNQLLWAGRHLNYSNRLRVYRKAFSRLCSAFFPGPVIDHNVESLPRRYYWATTDWLNRLRSAFVSVGNHAEIVGVWHYLRGRFGDCPEKIRLWNKQ